MKLFLTSSAAIVLDKIVPMLDKKPSEMKVMFVPTAGDPEGENRPWMEADRNKLIELGFEVEDFDLKEKSETDVREKLSKTDVIFVAGGNTFYLLEKARESGFEKVVKELKDSDKIYIGSSAGSILAGPVVSPVAIFDDPKEAQLGNTHALGLVDFVVLPHYKKEKYDPYHEQVIKEFNDKFKLVPITDEQMVVSDGKSIVIY